MSKNKVDNKMVIKCNLLKSVKEPKEIINNIKNTCWTNVHYLEEETYFLELLRTVFIIGSSLVQLTILLHLLGKI